MPNPRPVNVLHLCAGNMFGGIERVLVTLARQAGACPQMRSTFAACFEGRLTDELREAGAAVEVLGAVRASRPWTGWLARRRLAKVIRRGRYDVVLAHACWPLAMLGPAVKKCTFGATANSVAPRAVPLVLWAHDILKNDNWVEQRAARVRPDLALALTGVIEQSIAGVFPGVGVRRAYCPVEPPATARSAAGVRAAVRTEFGTRDDAAVIVCASRLERWKGHAGLVAALTKLAADPRWECWVVGGAQRPQEDEYLAELKAAATAGGIGERVKFLGQRSDVPRILSAADVHCQPNAEPEPFGIAYVEAMYAGLPVVSTAIGGALELVDESAGVLVPPNDTNRLAAALADLIDHPERRQSFGNGGRARARELCDPAMAIAHLADTLAEVAGIPGNSRPPSTSKVNAKQGVAA